MDLGQTTVSNMNNRLLIGAISMPNTSQSLLLNTRALTTTESTQYIFDNRSFTIKYTCIV